MKLGYFAYLQFFFEIFIHIDCTLCIEHCPTVQSDFQSDCAEYQDFQS